MDSSVTAEKLLNLGLFFVVNIGFGCLGLLALVASCVRVDAARLPRVLAKARRQFAAPVIGPLPVATYRWVFRLVGGGFVVLTQFAIWNGLTSSGGVYPFGVLLPWAVAQWAIVLVWSGWVLWAFLRAASSTGELPLKIDPPIQPSRYVLEDRPVWTESGGHESSQGRDDKGSRLDGS